MERIEWQFLNGSERINLQETENIGDIQCNMLLGTE